MRSAQSSPNIRNLPFTDTIQNQNVKWFAIGSDWQDIPGNSSELRQFFNELLAGMAPAGPVPSTLCNTGSPPTMLRLIGGDPNNDVIVTTTSQSDNSSGNLAEYLNVAHAAVDNPDVIVIPGCGSRLSFGQAERERERR